MLLMALYTLQIIAQFRQQIAVQFGETNVCNYIT